MTSSAYDEDIKHLKEQKTLAESLMHLRIKTYNSSITQSQWLSGLVYRISYDSDKNAQILVIHIDGYVRQYEVQELKHVTKRAFKDHKGTDEVVMYQIESKQPPKDVEEVVKKLLADQKHLGGGEIGKSLFADGTFVGKCIEVWWPDEGSWYKGKVTNHVSGNAYRCEWADESEPSEWDMTQRAWKLAVENDGTIPMDEDPVMAAATLSEVPPATQLPRLSHSKEKPPKDGHARSSKPAAPSEDDPVVVYQDEQIGVVRTNVHGQETTTIIVRAGMNPDSVSVKVGEQCIAICEKAGKKKGEKVQEYYFLGCKKFVANGAVGQVADDGSIKVDVPMQDVIHLTR